MPSPTLMNNSTVGTLMPLAFIETGNSRSKVALLPLSFQFEIVPVTFCGLPSRLSSIGSFVGVWLAGYLYDRFHTYNGVLAVSVALGAFAALVNMPVNEKPLAQRRAAAAA